MRRQLGYRVCCGAGNAKFAGAELIGRRQCAALAGALGMPRVPP